MRFRRRMRMPRRRRFRRTRNIRRIVRHVASRIPEVKFHAQGIGNTVRNVPYSIKFFNDLSQGTTAITRIGHEVRAKRISMRFYINLAFVSLGSINAIVRVLVCHPRKGLDNGDMDLAITSMLGVTSIPDPTQVYVLFDKHYAVSADTNVAAVNTGFVPFVRLCEYSKPVRHHARYAGVSNNCSVGPALYVLTNLAAADNSSVTVNGYTRFSYRDA